MTDKQMYKELERFANEHTLAKDVVVSITQGCTSFEARDKDNGAKYEDVVLLADLVRGAWHFLQWKRGKTRRKKVGI